MKKVYLFNEVGKVSKNLLGGKGYNLAKMKKMNLPVPNGFIVSTSACVDYYNKDSKFDQKLKIEIEKTLRKLEKKEKKFLGDKQNPLLLSIRSGARVSMPGMMDTILNLGINDEVVKTLGVKTNNEKFAYDSYRRFIEMYGEVVKGIDKKFFSEALFAIKKEKKVDSEQKLKVEDFKKIVDTFKKIYKQKIGEDFPQNPKIQLIESIEAVFKSWNTPRAKYYRKINNIPHEWGTAVNIQMMVFGNKGKNSGSGVCFSRNPTSGENKLFGEYLIDAQGEDVVAGTRTPKPISKLEENMKYIYDELLTYSKKLETYYKDMQDMEFTIENNKLYMLQTRSGKRTIKASVKIARDLVEENIISKKEAIMQIDPNQVSNLFLNYFDEKELKNKKPIAKGLPASPGASFGKVVFNSKDVVTGNQKKEDVILVRTETSPEDIEGMNLSKGVLTSRGGMTSHAAVVARGMGICCIAGCSDISIYEKEKKFVTKEGKEVREGDYISIDGKNGNVYLGTIATKKNEKDKDFENILSWSDEISRMSVRANADTNKDVKKSLSFGAKGVGLCRTEHMFFGKEKISLFRKMILADTKEKREEILLKLEKIQTKDFISIFKSLKSMPITIRYLDPPLHEFLPNSEEEKEKIAKETDKTKQEIINKINELKEFNPMMGHRGCRLFVSFPEILKMQTRAIFNAYKEVEKQNPPIIELMIPLVVDIKEFDYLKKIIEEEINSMFEKKGIPNFQIGTMVELPRTCFIAKELSKTAHFFSFGTNDLTQMTFGFSRDDSGKFLEEYYKENILDDDPFAHVDQIGVGALMKEAIRTSKAKNIKLGVCGEHGGDPKSIYFFEQIGLDYVSCSPFRVPIARLAVAQGKIKKDS